MPPSIHAAPASSPPSAVSFRGELTQQQFSRVQSLLLPPWARAYVVAPLCVFTFISIGVGWRATIESPRVAIPDLLFALLLLAACALITRFGRLKAWRANARMHGQVHGQVTDEGVEWNTSTTTSRFPWNKLLSFKESGELVLVFYSPRCALYFPKQFFPGEEAWNSFRVLLASQLCAVLGSQTPAVAPDPPRGSGLVRNDVVAVILSAGELPRVVELSELDLIASNIELEGKVFVDAGAGDWLGFYDWLRTSEGLVIGVRQYLDNPSVFPSSRTFRGVEVDARHGVVRAFFGQAREFDEWASCDQDFGDNRLLVADDAVAITFCRASAVD